MRRAYHHNSNLMSDIASNASLDAKFAHVLKQRGGEDAHYNDDIWALRRDWLETRARLQAELLAGNYLFSPVQTWDTDKSRLTIGIIYQMMNRCEIINAEHILKEHGISKGCPISPLLGAMMLKFLDDVIPKEYFYVRYMDDWLIATNSRHGLRRVIKKMHHIMHQLGFKLAFDKTFIGSIKRGFDFLGYRFNHTGLIGLVAKTIQNHKIRIAGLYETGATQERIVQYVSRWKTWCLAGLPCHLGFNQKLGDM